MATPEYPTALPGVAQWRIKPSTQVLAGGDEGAPRDVRRRSVVPGALGQAGWSFIEADYAAFVAWWKTDLLRGHKWFWIELPSAGGITWHIARFNAPYQARMNGHRSFVVSAELEIRERQFEPNLRDEQYDFLEDFESGFGAYDLVLGSLDPFSIGPGMTGNCMHADNYTSSTQAIIQRSVPRMLCSFLSARFRVTTFGTDDALALVLMDGAATPFYMIPTREGFYDGARRTMAAINGGALFPISLSQVTLNKIYRINMYLNSGMSASRIEFIAEEEGAILLTTTFTAAPFYFDALRFTLDPSVGTCETDYDDIYVLS